MGTSHQELTGSGMLKKVITETMKSVDLQTLQQLASVKVAIEVCESEDVLCTIGNFNMNNDNGETVGYSDGQWRLLRGKVKRKLEQIGVPDIIIDIILENLWPIAFEISKWILYHVEDIGINFPIDFCWTSQVVIDYEKTAETLIENETLNIKIRYKLACFYCLDSQVRSLWEQMSLAERRFFYIRKNLKKSDQNPIVLYWTYYIQEVPIDFWDCKALNHSYLFKYAVENGYLYATKYFLGKIKLQLRVRMIANSFDTYLCNLYSPEYIVKDYLAIACFLICEVRQDYAGIRYFNRRSLVFAYFLEWPMQKHFMIVVNQLRYYLTARMYGELLKRIFKKDLRGFKDHDYKELFMGFWFQMPETCKIFVNTESDTGFTIFMRFVKEHFGFVFDEKSFALKEKFRVMIFQQEISDNVTEKENVEFFKFLVRERVVTREFIEHEIIPLNTFSNFFLFEFGSSFSNLPLGELMDLIDGILGKPNPP